MRGLFVTGTDTGVGKTVVAAAIVAALRARGRAVAALKPVLTGLDEVPDPLWPPDHELLARAAGSSVEAVTSLTFGPPVSPHLAAEAAGVSIEPQALVGAIRAGAAGRELAVVEGVGGLLVPLAPGFTVRDLAVALALPLVIVARPGLGTINHTLLTVEAARRAGLEVTAVVLTPWPGEPTPIERSNRDTVARLAEVEVAWLPYVPTSEVESLRHGGEQLPLGRWLGLAD